ncbi:M57 family metalloprotease [Ekhidna sp.]|uniref:M57 family metalloprotease n=1 Tax=Ekhidna sp. TaxID=2608089 RepID=UPI003298664B
MKRKTTHLKGIVFNAILLIILLFTYSCSENVEEVYIQDEFGEVPEEIIAKLEKAGFDTSEGLRPFRDGYIVETDIFLTEEKIDALILSEGDGPASEQYRTNNLVEGCRTIQVFMDPDFGDFMQDAFDDALERYNALGLRLTFARTLNENNSDIAFDAFFERSQLLGFSDGFPVGGDPAENIALNTFHYNDAAARPDAATTIAHEIGHAIGFRHTDFMNRAFSCGAVGPNNNEGDAGVGANHINGTPVGPEAGSWMLACSNNTNRPFTNNDRIALNDTYGGLTITGNTLVCTGNNTFTLNDVPAGSVVTWQATPGNLLVQSTGNGVTAVLSANSSSVSSSGTLTYTVTLNGETCNISTNIWIGRPASPSSLFGPSLVSYGALVNYRGGIAQGATSYKWYLPYPYNPNASVVVDPSRWGIISGGNSRYMTAIAGPNNGLVQVMGVNACGTGGAKIMNVTVTTSGGGGGIMP